MKENEFGREDEQIEKIEPTEQNDTAEEELPAAEPEQNAEQTPGSDGQIAGQTAGQIAGQFAEEIAAQNHTEAEPVEGAADGNPAENPIPAEVQRPASGQTNQTDPRYNPYFQGYGEGQPRPQYSPYPPQARQNPAGTPQQPYNSYGQRGAWNGNPYAPNRQANPNPQQPQNGAYTQQPVNPQQPQTNGQPENQNNPYAAHAYGQNGGQITYTPTPASAKKAKKPVTRGALAIAVAACLIFSACAGFGGALLANKLNRSGASGTAEPETSVRVDSSDPVVIYRSVDEVTTSTSAVEGGDLTYAQAAALVKDSVVEINTEYTVYSMWFQYATGGAGSGVILSEDGYIITNNHVITNESTGETAETITVRLTDGSEYKAKLVGTDSDADIAVIKIDATGLTAAQCGNSDLLSVGEELLVVGNPLGELGGTVTNGIVSATEREIQVEGVTMSLIQTNAAVNPGNSGGGMFNMKGQLIGVVNAKSSGSGIEGLGFAIPINDALSVSEQLLEYGYVRGKTMIGVSFKEMSSNSLFYFYNIKEGVYVESLTEGYNDKALEVGDRVVAVNGDTITSSADIKAIVSSSSVGDKLIFQVERNGKLTEVEVTCFEKVPETSQDRDIDFDDGKTK